MGHSPALFRVSGSIWRSAAAGALAILGGVLGLPAQATVPFQGTVSGAINGTAFAISIAGSADPATGHVIADYSGIPIFIRKIIIKMNCFITFGCRSHALESGGALNLLSVTGGNFQRTATVTFPTGEVLTMLHNVTNGPGGLTCVATANGTLPVELPTDVVTIDDFEELWQQSGPGSLTATSQRYYRVNGVPKQYTWNFGVTYSGSVAMPFPETARSTGNISVYDPVLNVLHQESTNTVEPAQAASHTAYGVGCYAPNPLTLSASPAPVLGSVVNYTASSIPEVSPGAGIVIIIIIIDFVAIPAPGLDLGFLGAPGCPLLVGSVNLTTSAVGVFSSLSVPLAIPASAPVGFDLFLQAASLNDQNAFGVTTSNGLRSHLAPF